MAINDEDLTRQVHLADLSLRNELNVSARSIPEYGPDQCGPDPHAPNIQGRQQPACHERIVGEVRTDALNHAAPADVCQRISADNAR